MLRVNGLQPQFHRQIHFNAIAAFPGSAQCHELPSGTVGQFVTLRRSWKSGDRIEMDLPMKLRLEAIDPQHPQKVDLLGGRLGLFAITVTPPAVTARQLLAARRTGPQLWQVETAGGALKMLPFTAIADQQYSTYLNVQSG